MSASTSHTRWLAVLGVLLLIVVLNACGESPALTATPVATNTPTPTLIPASPTPEQSAAAIAELDVSIDSDTVWQEVFDTLTVSEQSCVRNALGDELESALGRPVVSKATPEQWEVSLFSCLAPETARAVYLSILITEMQEDVELSEDEVSCMRKSVAATDAAAVIAALAQDADDHTAAAESFTEIFRCLPDLLLTTIIPEMGLEREELSEDEVACLRGLIANVDWGALAFADEDFEANANFAVGMISCVPALLLSSALGEEVELSEEEVSCLRESFAAIDSATLLTAADDPAGFAALAPDLVDCVPDLFISIFIAETGASIEDLSEEEWDCLRELVADIDLAALIASPDDSAADVEFGVGLLNCVPDLFSAGDEEDSVEEATAVTVGEAVQGALDYADDKDFFVFQAEEGVFYQIDVALGTLSDSVVELYDADELWLAYNDDHGDSLASRIIWEAPRSGEYYAAVEGYGTGSYTLTVTVSDITDDHADAVEEATAVTVGEAVQGALDHTDDIDVFVFQAEEGVLYRIDVALGTLSDSLVGLYDADEQELAYNDDHGDSLASRIIWEALRSGEYYVAVEGYGTGSYTLTIALSAPTPTPPQENTGVIWDGRTASH